MGKRPLASDTGTTFVEVIQPATTKDAALSACSSTQHETCQLQIGDTGVTIPIGYPVNHLAEVLRAVRMSQ